jgi:hypothetical protein
MKYLQVQWKVRLTVVLVVSFAVSLLITSVEMTDWAAQINQEGYSHGEEGGAPGAASALRYVLPLVKEIILIGVPLGISLLVMNIFGRIKRSAKARKQKV